MVLLELELFVVTSDMLTMGYGSKGCTGFGEKVSEEEMKSQVVIK